jgi:hypothetical protein
MFIKPTGQSVEQDSRSGWSYQPPGRVLIRYLHLIIKQTLADLLAEETDGEEIIITAGNRPVGIIQPVKAYIPGKTSLGKPPEKTLPQAE